MFFRSRANTSFVSVCPIGLQAVECEYEDRACKKVRAESAGYCAAWSYFMLQTALKFPDLWTDDLIVLAAKALDNDPKAFRKFISNYGQFLYKNIELMIIDEKIRKPVPWKLEKGTREGQRPATKEATEKARRRYMKAKRGEMWKWDPRTYMEEMAEKFIESQREDAI